MKIQYLAVIFILIIMPITIVFGEYINTQITFASTETIYDQRLLNSTHDAVKAFQINTINTPYYSPQVRLSYIEGAVNTFLNSLKSAFKYDGNVQDVMKEYVPAVVFTMYDGYYVYSPYQNTLTGMDLTTVDDGYKKRDGSDGKVLDGIKPYVSYTCKYRQEEKKRTIMITYSMDNYIHVDIFFDENASEHAGEHLTNEGYLLNVTRNGSTDAYQYAGCTFKATDRGCFSEFIPEIEQNDDGTYSVLTRTLSNGETVVKLAKYYYTVRDGTKYYYEGKVNGALSNKYKAEPDDNDKIFYISNTGNRVYQVNNYKNNKARFLDYYSDIFYNVSAFNYYKEAYEFKQWFIKNVGDLSTDDIVKGENEVNYANYDFARVDSIFGNFNNIEESNSEFNRHRADVIRAIITTNLMPAIAGFTKYSNTNEEFLMPKISDTDWELLENNICVAAFFQGIRIGGRRYNSYAVVPNAYNKEYVDENDIYILKWGKVDENLENSPYIGTYAKPNEGKLTNNKIIQDVNLDGGLGYQPAVNKINFEKRLASSEMNDYYIPLCYDSNGLSPYLASYASVVGSTGINGLEKMDMYQYIEEKAASKVKKAYLYGLARERKGSFKYTVNGIENILNYKVEGNKIIVFTQPNKTIQAYNSDSGEGGNYTANNEGIVTIVGNAISSRDFYVIIDGQKFSFRTGTLQNYRRFANNNERAFYNN